MSHFVYLDVIFSIYFKFYWSVRFSLRVRGLRDLKCAIGLLWPLKWTGAIWLRIHGWTKAEHLQFRQMKLGLYRANRKGFQKANHKRTKRFHCVANIIRRILSIVICRKQLRTKWEEEEKKAEFHSKDRIVTHHAFNARCSTDRMHLTDCPLGLCLEGQRPSSYDSVLRTD